MPTSRPAPPRAAITVVLATVFIDIVGFGIILPILPGEAARLGSTPAAIGVLVASYSAVQLLCAPLWGRASDRFGRRPVLLVSLAGSVVSYALFALAGSWTALLVSRLLDGASGATVNVAQAYLADRVPPGERARAMGMIGAAVGTGFIVGPLLGGLAVTRGAATAGWLAAGITVINLLAAWRVLPESTRVEHPEPPIPATPQRFRIALPLGVVFLATLAFTVMYVVFPLWGEQTVGADRSMVGYWFAMVGLVTAIVQGGMLGRIVARIGEARTAWIGAGLLAAGLALVPSVGTADGAAIWLVLVVLGTGYGLAGPSMLGLVSRLTGSRRQGRVLGVAQSVTSAARIIGPVAAGVVMGLGGADLAFEAGAAIAALGMGAAVVLGARGITAAR